MSNIQSRTIIISRKAIIALAFALLFALLGIFDDVGYRLNYIREISFITHSQLGYADAVFSCDIIYNPVLYPFYWITGNGHYSGTFRVIYEAEGYGPGEFGQPIWPMTPQQRYDYYIIKILTWGTLANLLALLAITATIEIIGKRSLYLILFFGIFGFSISQILGTVLGLVIGFVTVILTMFKYRDNFLAKWWRSLWEGTS